MPAEKLGSYILDHDEKSFYVDQEGQMKKIDYSSSSGKVEIDGEAKNELAARTHHEHTDFKLSFDELNFESREEAVEQLESFVNDIADLKINKANKTSIDNRQMRVEENFDDLSAAEQEKSIRSFIEDEYKDTKDIGTPELLDWERSQDGWGNEIVDIKLKKKYGRTENLRDSIISIHTQSRDEVKSGQSNYEVKPHIHITIPKGDNWGKNFCYLRQELSKKLVEHNLTSSDNVERKINQEEYKEYKILKDRLTSFSWVVNKHEDAKYIKQQLNQYNRNDNCVKLDNVEEKLDKYLKLGGSYDFARKLQTNLKEKLNYEIEVAPPAAYKKAEKDIQAGNYREIINTVKEKALAGEKISEKYKEYAKEVLQQDNINIKEAATARAIKDVVKNRGYYLDQNWNKVINKQKINQVCDRQITRIEKIKEQKINKKIESREYLNQKQLREDLKGAGIDDIQKITDKSEVAVIWEGVEQFAEEQINLDEIENISQLQNEVNKLNEPGLIENDVLKEKKEKLSLSKNWKNKLTKKLHQKKIKNKINKLKSLRTKAKTADSIKAALNAADIDEGIRGNKITEEIDKKIDSVKDQAIDLTYQAIKSLVMNFGNDELIKNIKEQKDFINKTQIEAFANYNDLNVINLEKTKSGYKVKIKDKDSNLETKLTITDQEIEETIQSYDNKDLNNKIKKKVENIREEFNNQIISKGKEAKEKYFFEGREDSEKNIYRAINAKATKHNIEVDSIEKMKGGLRAKFRAGDYMQQIKFTEEDIEQTISLFKLEKKLLDKEGEVEREIKNIANDRSLSQLKDKLENIKNEIETNKDKIRELKENKKGLFSVFASNNKEEIEELEKEINNLKEQKNSLKETIGEVQELKNRRKEIKSKRKEAEDLLEKLGGKVKQKVKQIEQEIIR